jgi:hypothetical protein
MNKELLKKQIAEMHLKQEQLLKESQDACSHMAGNLSKTSQSLDFTAIVWHRLNNNIYVGLCPNCSRKFWPGDSDYDYWFDKNSFSTRSKAVADSSSLPHMRGIEVDKDTNIQKELNSQFNAFNPRFCDGVIFTVPDLIVDSNGIRIKIKYPDDTDTHF